MRDKLGATGQANQSIEASKARPHSQSKKHDNKTPDPTT